MSTLALDPSLSCTGFALLSGDTRDTSKIEECGTIAPDGGDDDLFARLWSLAELVAGEVRRLKPTVIVIERPMDKSFGAIGARGRISAPNYGMAVWAVYREVCAVVDRSIVQTPTPADWVGRGSVPSSKGDPHKERRVRYCEYLYPDWKGRFGAKTRAGNIADAVLLARWSIGMAEFGRMIGAAGVRKTA